MIGLRSLRIGPRIGARIGLAGDTAPSTTSLSVALSDSVDPVITGVGFSYSLVVTNTGGLSASNVSATIALDASVAFVSGSGTGWTVNHSAGVVTCTRASLAVGAAPTITINVTSGGAALTASSTANATADNAAAAAPSVQTTVVKLVAKDATSGIRMPASLTQWQDFNAYHVAIGTANYPNVTPTALWLVQEASGALADSIGSTNLAQSGAGHLYQQAVAGWSVLAVKTVDGTASQKWINSTTAPNPNTTSTHWLGYLGFPAVAPAAIRDLMANSAALDLRLTAAGKLAVVNGATTTGTANPLGGVHIVEVKHDLTNSVFAGYSDQEKLAGTFAASASNPMIVLGGQTAAAGDVGYLYVAEFSGAAAELTDAQIRARQTALGWSPAW